MEDKYEVSVTVGVRQLGNAAGGFQASDTFTINVHGFDDLFFMMGEVHDLRDRLTARSTGPQDRRR